MTVRDMMRRLGKMPPHLEITILDGFNGGGQPRTINLEPTVRKLVSKEKSDTYEWDDEDLPEFHCDTSDIESKEGDLIVDMGYGFY